MCEDEVSEWEAVDAVNGVNGGGDAVVEDSAGGEGGGVDVGPQVSEGVDDLYGAA